MFDIFGSPDHLTETGVATNTTAPIKVAPIKNIFCIVVLLNKDTRVVLNHSANQLFELSRCKCLLICGCCLIKIEQWKSAVVFKIEHPAHTPSGPGHGALFSDSCKRANRKANGERRPDRVLLIAPDRAGRVTVALKSAAHHLGGTKSPTQTLTKTRSAIRRRAQSGALAGLRSASPSNKAAPSGAVNDKHNRRVTMTARGAANTWAASRPSPDAQWSRPGPSRNWPPMSKLFVSGLQIELLQTPQTPIPPFSVGPSGAPPHGPRAKGPTSYRKNPDSIFPPEVIFTRKPSIFIGLSSALRAATPGSTAGVQ
jgi:hypothetical protein